MHTGFPLFVTSLMHAILKRIHPAQVIVLSFLLLVLVGMLLLMLPVATADGQGADMLTALFTATSAVCVTGLAVENTLTFWSGFGKTVIIALVQIGGLGLVTFMMLLMVLTGQKITLRDRLVIQTAFNQPGISGMIRLLRTIALGTLLLEVVAGVLLTLRFLREPGMVFSHALQLGFFHAISAFCNAGFDLIGAQSLVPYVGDIWVNGILMLLVVLGGLGFSVWNDLLTHARVPTKKPGRHMERMWNRLTLHSKIVLSSSLVFILGGTLVFFLAELTNPRTLASLSWGERVLASLFQSVSARTAGFATLDMSALRDSTKLLTSLLMLVGGSPGGTAGGMKTVTICVVWFSILSTLRGRETIVVFGRRISLTIMLKSLSVLVLFSAMVLGATLALTISEQESGFHFLDFLFEAASACGTVGLTTGLTPHLSSLGRIVIIVCMFLGRLGPVTVALALSMRMQKRQDNLQYPKETVLIG